VQDFFHPLYLYRLMGVPTITERHHLVLLDPPMVVQGIMVIVVELGIACLVGGFNPSQKYLSMGRIIPYTTENKKMKPPTSCIVSFCSRTIIGITSFPMFTVVLNKIVWIDML